MKKILPIIIVLALIGGGAYFYSNRQSGQDGMNGTPASGEESLQGSLESLVARGDSLKCEWEDNEVSVTSYIKGEMVYSETQTQGMMQYSIIKDNCTWTWGDSNSPAVQYCFEDFDYSDYDPAEGEGYEAPDGMMGEEVQQETQTPEYNCSAESIPDSMFEPPSDIEFTSF